MANVSDHDLKAKKVVKAFWAKHDQVDGKMQKMARKPSAAQPAATPPAPMAARKSPPSPPRPPSSIPVQNNSPQANLQNPYAAAIPVAQFKNAVQYLRKSSPNPGGY